MTTERPAPVVAAEPFDADLEPSAKEVIESPEPPGFPLPEIFLTGEGPNSPTNRQITLVWVDKKGSDKQFSNIDCVPIETLPTLKDVVEAFGPGTYRFTGRGDDRRDNIKVSFQKLGDPDAAERRQLMAPAPARSDFDLAKLVTTIELLAKPILTLFEQNRQRAADERAADREEYSRRMNEQRELDRRHHETMMELVTGLQNSRITELRERLAEPRPAADGASSDEYQRGLADAVQLLEEAKSRGVVGGDGADKLMDLFGSFVAGAAMKPAAPQIPPAGKNGNGIGDPT